MHTTNLTASNPEYIYTLYQRGIMNLRSITQIFKITSGEVKAIVKDYQQKTGFKKRDPHDIDIVKITSRGARTADDSFDLEPSERKRLEELRRIKEWKWRLVCLVDKDRRGNVSKNATLQRAHLFSEEYDFLLNQNRRDYEK